MSAGVLVLNANSALIGGPAMSDLVLIRRKFLISANCNKLQKSRGFMQFKRKFVVFKI
jgi:hypothetical protein